MEFKYPKSAPRMDITNFIKNPSHRDWEGPFSFVQAADTQFGMIGSYKLKQDVPTWDVELKLTREAIKRINEMTPKPKFFVVCGDMLDALPFDQPSQYYKAAKKTDLETRKLQYKDFIKVFKELNSEIKLVCVCGNHDVGESPTKESVKIYRDQFGTDYFSFWVGGVKFVVLNSQFFFSPKALPNESEAQIHFLNTIADSKAKHIVVFQHIPFFIQGEDEDDQYYNIPKENRLMLLEKLYTSGVRYIFCGHYHANASATYRDMEIAVTSALGAPMGKDPSGFRIVKVEENTISHEYIKLRESTEFESMIKLSNKNKCAISYTRFLKAWHSTLN